MELKDQIELVRQLDTGRFNPPASDSDIEKLLSSIPEMPVELVTVLKCFNGEIHSGTPVFGEAFFMSSHTIIEHQKMFNEFEFEEDENYLFEDNDPEYCEKIRNVLYDQRWIPFMDLDGIVSFMDLNPTTSGVKGQIFSMDIGGGGYFVEYDAVSLAEYIDNNMPA